MIRASHPSVPRALASEVRHAQLRRDDFWLPNSDGWLLQARRVVAPRHLDRGRRPLLIIPGYGMNSFIFGFHPRGTSMEGALACAGFEVWSVNLRFQGDSRRHDVDAPPPSLRAFATIDLPAAIDGVLARTLTHTQRVDLLGCSLGGSIAYATLALQQDAPVGAVVAMGSPLRWTEIHPAVRVAFSSPTLVGAVPFAGTRAFARLAFPILARVPGLLSIYMNTSHVDLRRANALTQTVDDPHPRVNKDIAYWMQQRDMVLSGINVSEHLAQIDLPLLIVLANRDGIVPPTAALSVMDVWGGDTIDILRVGNRSRWYSHADLFIGDASLQDVFAPIAHWLTRHQDTGV